MRSTGFTPLILLVLVAFATALAGGGYYLYRQLTPSSTTPQTVLRATDADFAFIADATLRRHFVAQANQTSFRTQTFSDGANLYYIMEVELSGEDFNTRSIELDSQKRETRQRLELGNTIYVKDYSDNTWWKQLQPTTPTPQTEQPGETEPVDFKETYSQPDLKFETLGQEACGTLTCYKYRQLNGGPEGMAFSRTFWFDTQKFLLRKEATTVGEFTNSVDYTYDNLNLTPPTPTKDVPEGQDIFNYYYGLPSSAQNQSPPKIDSTQLKSLEEELPGDINLPSDIDY